jgi:imidazolonepropionase-like amidohydrolase
MKLSECPVKVAARKREFQQALRITAAAYRAGVPFMAGTDSGGVPYLYYGSRLHDELALLMEAGFTPMQALQCGTRDSARSLGLGTNLERSSMASRLTWCCSEAQSSCKVDNVRKIRAVMVRGHYLGRAALDALLAQVRSAVAH